MAREAVLSFVIKGMNSDPAIHSFTLEFLIIFYMLLYYSCSDITIGLLEMDVFLV